MNTVERLKFARVGIVIAGIVAAICGSVLLIMPSVAYLYAGRVTDSSRLRIGQTTESEVEAIISPADDCGVIDIRETRLLLRDHYAIGDYGKRFMILSRCEILVFYGKDGKLKSLYPLYE